MLKVNNFFKKTVDVAVRRAVMTSVGQVAQKISLNNFQQLSLIEPRPDGGTGQAARLGWEISAHVGARPSHAAYQGRQYPQSQYYTIVEPLITDYNCRHSAYPIILGLGKPNYTAEELANIDPPPVEWQIFLSTSTAWNKSQH
jgi:hypothetical protein